MDVDRLGKSLFGNQTRLRLALWVLDRDKSFFQSEPPRDVGVINAVRLELSKLVELAMLTTWQPEGVTRIYYERTQTPLWAIFEAAKEAIRTSS